MPRVSITRRVLIALVGYGVLAVFGLVYVLATWNSPGLTTTEALIISGIAVAPLVLALLWEHLKGVKVGQIEITLNEVAPSLHVELASQIQNLEASVTPALTAAMRAAVGNSEFKLVEINLRANPYWWSTRLYLLAALAEEYTYIERLVFVEQDAARMFIGMAAPAAARKEFGRNFPDLRRVFQSIQQDVLNSFKPPDVVTEVEAIINQWSMQPLFTLNVQGAATMLTFEKDVKRLTTSASLREWLPSTLETETRQWSGESPTHELYGKILSCSIPYVPLLNGQRLQTVVNRSELAEKLAASVIS